MSLKRQLIINGVSLVILIIFLGCATTHTNERYLSDRYDNLYNQGIDDLDMKKYGQAIAKFTQVIDANPSYCGAFLGRGQALFRIGNYRQAIPDLTRAIELNPENSYDLTYFSYLARGDCNRLLKQNEQAVLDFSEAINLKPDSFDAYYSRALTYSLLKKYSLAFPDCENAIRLNNRFAKGYFLQAMLFEETGRKADAIKAYRTFIQYGTADHLNDLVQKAWQRIDELQKT